MNFDWKEIGISLVVTVVAIALYFHVVAPMLSSKGISSDATVIEG